MTDWYCVYSFRRLLVLMGKTIPFIFVFIVVLNYIEIAIAIMAGSVINTCDGCLVYYTPLSIWIGDIVMIDIVDVILLYIIGISLEYCKYTFRCVNYLTLNLLLRYTTESVELEEEATITICFLLVLFGFLCLAGGVKKVRRKYFS